MKSISGITSLHLHAMIVKLLNKRFISYTRNSFFRFHGITTGMMLALTNHLSFVSKGRLFLFILGLGLSQTCLSYCPEITEADAPSELEKECKPEKWLAERPGWGIDLNINIGYASSRSQFNADADNNTTDDLYNSGKRVSQVIPVPFFRVDYTLDTRRTQFFFGNSRDNIAKGEVQVEFGITHQFKDKTQITFALFPEIPLLGDTWEDPFLVGSPRIQTRETAFGGRVSIDKIRGIPISFKYAVAESSIKKEASGVALGLSSSEQALLHRDAFFQRATIELPGKLTKNTFVQIGFEYTGSNAKGEANSFDEFAARASLFKKLGPHFWVLTLKYGQRKHDAANPVYDVTQKDDRLSLFSAYSYDLSIENVKAVVLGAYRQNHSNITFYESKGGFISTGLAYSYR